MKEIGVVSVIKGNLAEIEIKEGQACSQCRICIFKSNGTMAILVNNSIGAKIGDTVEIIIPEHKVILSSFLLFIMPIICFYTGYIIKGIDLALFYLVIYSILLYFIDKKFTSNARISRLLS